MSSAERMVRNHAMGILLSAGLNPEREERRRLSNAAWRHPITRYGASDAVHGPACDLLEELGYDPDRDAEHHLALPECGLARTDPSPIAGDAVRLTGRWSIAMPGTIMTLSSCDVPGGLRIGRGGHYMGDDGTVSLTVGGPSSYLALDVSRLVPTGLVVRRPFWRFFDLAGPDQGVDFTRPVALWEWNGSDADFIHHEEELAA